MWVLKIDKNVAPLAGAWIETTPRNLVPPRFPVAPLAGAWIETRFARGGTLIGVVAPLAGAWIETPQYIGQLAQSGGRAPRGRVD